MNEESTGYDAQEQQPKVGEAFNTLQKNQAA
jgi:hypothetical protein